MDFTWNRNMTGVSTGELCVHSAISLGVGHLNYLELPPNPWFLNSAPCGGDFATYSSEY